MTDTTADDILEQAARTEQAAPRPPADLAYVRDRAERLIAVERELADCAKREAALKKERTEIRIHQLPEAMSELRITQIGIGNVVVAVEPMVEGSLPKDETKMLAAVNYVVDLGEGGCVKRRLELDLPKGDAVIEEKIVEALLAVSESLRPRVVPSIHHSTYSALCRRLVREGRVVNYDVLGIFVGHIARIVEDEK